MGGPNRSENSWDSSDHSLSLDAVLSPIISKWSLPTNRGRTQMGSDGLNRILTSFCLLGPIRLRSVPLKTHDFNGSDRTLTDFIWTLNNSMNLVKKLSDPPGALARSDRVFQPLDLSETDAPSYEELSP